MKRIKFLLFIILFFQIKSEAQDTLSSTNPIIIQIQNMDFGQFVGKPIDTLLAYLPSGYTELKMQMSIVAKKAGYFVVKYAPKTYVYIAVREFNYMNPNLAPTGDPFQNWDVNLFRKENISFALAFNASECFNGCQHIRKIN